MINSNFKGINRDVLPEQLPENFYTFALNALISQPDITSISNENSNSLCIDFDGVVLGKIHLPHRNKYVLFLSSNEIILFDYVKCESELLFQDNCLNLKRHIRGVYKTLDSCAEDIIFWVDGINPVRYLNIDNKKDILTCSDLNLFPCESPIKIDIEEVINNGGIGLESGSYQFVARYVSSTSQSNFFTITPTIPIYEDNSKDKFENINGSKKGVLTSKAIRLKINANSNSNNWTGIHLVIIKHINGTSIVEFVNINSVNITEYIYDGSVQGTAIDIAEVLTPTINYLYANLIEEHQGRLFLSGIKKAKNLNYQKHANEIKVTYFTKKFSILDGYKRPLMNLNKTFRGNEIYSLGIRLIFCDGTKSFPYHIPGRQKQQNVFPVDKEENEDIYSNKWGFWDSSIIDTDDPNNFFECPKERWEIYNTSYRTFFNPDAKIVKEFDSCGLVTEEKHEVYSEGELAYYESNEKYPEQRDCEGNLIYPHTILPNGDIEMDFVRHHRMPDRSNEIHFINDNDADFGGCILPSDKEARCYNDTFILPIGLKFSNIFIPESDIPIVGYEIVYTKRTDANRSVVSSGIYINTFKGVAENKNEYAIPKFPVNGHAFTTFDIIEHPDNSNCNTPNNVGVNNEKDSYVFFGADTQFTDRFIDSTYTKIDVEVGGKGVMYGSQAVLLNEETDNKDTLSVDRYNFNLRDTNLYSFNQVNRKIGNITYAPANSVVQNNSGIIYPLLNTAREKSVYLEHESDTKLQLLDPYNGQFFCDVPNDNTSDFSDFWLSAFVDPPFRIEKAAAIYGSLTRYKANAYGDFNSLTFIPTGICETELKTNEFHSTSGFGGDSYINYFSFVRTRRNNNDSLLGFFGRAKQGMALLNTYVESDLNVGLRNEDIIEEFETHYPKLMSHDLYLDPTLGPFDNLLVDASLCLLTQQYYNGITSSFSIFKEPNFYDFNFDYSKVNDLERFPILPFTFKDCNCNTELKNTIAVSDIDNTESSLDSWSIFRVNNYLNIPYTKGQISNIFSLNNEFYAHTTDNLWRVFTSQDRLLSDANVYIGSGSIFSQEPLYMYASSEGFAGLQQNDGWYKNELGYFFVDKKESSIYNFNEGLKKIDQGLIRWLQEHLQFLDPLAEDNSFRFPHGKGWHIGFDRYNSRLLITKKDRELLNQNDLNNLSWKNGYYYIDNNIIKLEEYFCDKSWTISYSFLTESIVSWHSYTPQDYLSTRLSDYELFSINNNGIYNHIINKQDYQTFYDTYYPHIIETKSASGESPLQTSVLNNINYFQDAYEVNVNNLRTYKFETFNKVIVYNDKESTNLIELQNKLKLNDNDYFIENENFVDRRESIWSFNNLRRATKQDLDEPIWIRNCSVFEELNSNAFIQYNWWEEPQLRNNYWLVRLIKDDSSLYKIVTKYIVTNAKISI